MNKQFVTFPPKAVSRELYLIGFRLDPTAEGPQFYTLIGVDDGSECPITRGDRILFFRTPDDALKALVASDNGFRDVRPLPTELELLCDIGEALYVANAEKADSDGLLFEVIAVFDDLLRAVKLNVPDEYAAVLGAVAGRLHDTPEFATFLEENGLSREKLEDALMWCVGAVSVKSSWVG
ncbi:MAG TPA: hypothetical protein VM578_12250 [Candidatus Saccharimonadales bacterium]|nr:hypothetical protein [Candidatus Saccharimonadales bacterium]